MTRIIGIGVVPELEQNYQVFEHGKRKCDRRVGNVALVPLYVAVLFNICRQSKLPVQLFFGLSIPFFIICMVCFWRGTVKLTLDELLGKSSFAVGDSRSWLTMMGFVVFTAAIAGYFRVAWGPSSLKINSFEPFYLFSPLVEEALVRCILMNALRKSVSDSWAVVLTIPVWLSFHDLSVMNAAVLALSEVIFCVCYLRFSSLGCCYILHLVWDIIVEL